VFCWVLQTAETIVQGLNFPNLTPRLEKMPWSKMLFNNQSNNQSTITVDSPRQQKPMFRGEHNGPGHFIWLSRSKGMTVEIWIRDYNPPRCFQ
jgi:hypothetical protein